ncbi:elongation of very long chain fatty acids protein AAEL008004-like [Vespula squamosa]|uniref:Elongation of very long chain fatty acids protein AAEL008004-like n=1 Tax=Vespula squamosa TaxID=30214 RepID=A0ABD2C9G5_VESSQ
MNCTIHVTMYTYYFLSTFGRYVQRIFGRYKFIFIIIEIVNRIHNIDVFRLAMSWSFYDTH